MLPNEIALFYRINLWLCLFEESRVTVDRTYPPRPEDLVFEAPDVCGPIFKKIGLAGFEAGS